MGMPTVQWLKMVNGEGGVVSEYPFVEFGGLSALVELEAQGLVVRIHSDNDLDSIQITEKGRETLKSLNPDHGVLSTES